MIIVMKTEATEAQVIAIQKHIRELGFKDHLVRGVERNVVAVLGAVYPELLDEFSVLDGVDSAVRIMNQKTPRDLMEFSHGFGFGTMEAASDRFQGEAYHKEDYTSS